MTVSIITTTYNSEMTLRDTFESVLEQSYKNIEYIVIDGASKDGTLDIIREYETRFTGRMHWLSEPDNGLYDALNKGISKATGDIIGILNSDDFFTSSNIIEQIVENFVIDIDAIYGDIHFVNNEDVTKCVRYYSSKNFRPWRLRWGFMPAHPSFYVRRALLVQNGLYALNYKLAADYDMMVRLFYKAKIKAKYIPLDMVTMRTGGMSTRNLKNRLQLTKEDAKACRHYGLYSNFIMCSVKYLTKIFEFL